MKKQSLLRKKIFGSFVLNFLIFFSLVFTFVSCEKKQVPPPQENFGVRIVSIPGQIDAEAYKSVIAGFKSSNPNLIMEVTAEATAIDAFSKDPLSMIKGTDVLVFPSIVTSTLQSQKSAFYPQSATETTTYKTITPAFAAEKGLWAVPLTLDPVVMIAKKNAFNLIGEDGSNFNWNKILIVSNMSLEKGVKKPHLVFTTGRLEGLTDSIAALEFAFGFAQDPINSATDFTSTMNQLSLAKVMQASNKGLETFMIAKDETLKEIPQVETLSAFVSNPNAIFTIARLSDYFALPADQQNQLSFAPAGTDHPVIPCYGVAVAVPLEAKYPARAKEFIKFLNDKMGELAQKSHTLPANPQIPQAWQVFSKDSLPQIRINNKNIDSKLALEILSGTDKILLANMKWLPAFSVPIPKEN